MYPDSVRWKIIEGRHEIDNNDHDGLDMYVHSVKLAVRGRKGCGEGRLEERCKKTEFAFCALPCVD